MSNDDNYRLAVGALARARALLPNGAFGSGDLGTIAMFDEFLGVGEIELALGSIANIAQVSKASKQCWDEIMEGARILGVPEEVRTPDRLHEWDGWP